MSSVLEVVGLFHLQLLCCLVLEESYASGGTFEDEGRGEAAEDARLVVLRGVE